jgi:hypothetical protein
MDKKYNGLVGELLQTAKDNFDVHPKNNDDILKREILHYLSNEISFNEYEYDKSEIETLNEIKSDKVNFLNSFRFAIEMRNILD